VLNPNFSLFLYAVNEVVKAVTWFLAFLTAVLFMFSDAARTAVAVTGVCVGVAEESDFCSDSFLALPIMFYSVLAGDVALEVFEFQSSQVMVAIFVFFSFFSIIILLNVLVAIVIDSYERSKQRSREIFCRARIEYAAHLVARKQFLTPKERTDFHVKYVPRNARRALRLTYTFISAVTLLFVEYGFYGSATYLSVEQPSNAETIRSLTIVYVVVGSIFNAYIVSVASIAVLARYQQQCNSSNDCQPTVISSLLGIVDLGVKLFHRLMGFNVDGANVLTQDKESEGQGD